MAAILGMALVAAALLAVPAANLGPRTRAEVAGVKIGDEPAKVREVLGAPAKAPVELSWKPGRNVQMWQYDLDPQASNIPNLSVTFVDGRVWRVASLHSRYATRDGLRVGDSLAKAQKLYGTGIEDDADSGLVPWRFICDGQVIKVIVSEHDHELLAVGVETPANFKLTAPPPWGMPVDPPEPILPGDSLSL